MLYFILIILFLTIILYLIYKDFTRVLKITSIITAVSGLLTFVTGYLIKFVLGNRVNFINISKITNLVLSKFIKNSIYLLIISLIELIIYVVFKYYFRKKRVATT